MALSSLKYSPGGWQKKIVCCNIKNIPKNKDLGFKVH